MGLAPPEDPSIEHWMGVVDYMMGHKEHRWKEGDLDSIKEAERIFNEKVKAGWMAFKLEAKKLGERITQFDPGLPRIMLLPPIAGG